MSGRLVSNCEKNKIVFLDVAKPFLGQSPVRPNRRTFGEEGYQLNRIDSLDNVPLELFVERDEEAILFIDVVSSVAVIESDERRAVTRWISILEAIEGEVLSNYDGMLKKSLGDGLLCTFPVAQMAVGAALSIQKLSKDSNAPLPDAEHIHLRIGIELTRFFEDSRDIYGHGVNVAARLMGLAGPGEIVVSARVRDHLVTDVDAEIEDLGSNYLKNVSAPVRAFRIGPPAMQSSQRTDIAHDLVVPRLAVLPFRSGNSGTADLLVGDLLTDEITNRLSLCDHLSVISRLSVLAFRNRDASLEQVSSLLNVNYVLSGSYATVAGRVRLIIELADVRSNNIIWNTSLQVRIDEFTGVGEALITDIASRVNQAIFGYELKHVRNVPLPNLQSYSLLIAAIALMHRMSQESFLEAKRLLEIVMERWGQEATPNAWLAKWYVLRTQQGWTDDPDRDSFCALDAARRSLDADPESSLALTIDGLVHTHMLKAHDIAEERYSKAVAVNPSNALGWLLKGVGAAFVGNGPVAVADTQRAIRLSPLDPHRYYYDTLAATAHLANYQFELALDAAARSLRANRTHTSTHRAKAIALWHLGREEEARAAGEELMTLEPGLTLSQWRARSPASNYSIGNEWARALKSVGVPE